MFKVRLNVVFRMVATGAVVVIYLFGCNQERTILGESAARSRLYSVLSDTIKNRTIEGGLLSNQESAIGVAEPIVFKLFGEDKIKSQRPYEVYQIDGYWVIKGTISSSKDGGTFNIILNTSDARVIKVWHTR
jgi:hypothetical protein